MGELPVLFTIGLFWEEYQLEEIDLDYSEGSIS